MKPDAIADIIGDYFFKLLSFLFGDFLKVTDVTDDSVIVFFRDNPKIDYLFTYPFVLCLIAILYYVIRFRVTNGEYELSKFIKFSLLILILIPWLFILFIDYNIGNHIELLFIRDDKTIYNFQSIVLEYTSISFIILVFSFLLTAAGFITRRLSNIASGEIDEKDIKVIKFAHFLSRIYRLK